MNEIDHSTDSKTDDVKAYDRPTVSPAKMKASVLVIGVLLIILTLVALMYFNVI